MILVTNDDGIYSKGIATLYKTAIEVFGRKNVMVIAPSGPRSASGMSLTFHKPLRINRLSLPEVDGYSVSGTPADCVFSAVYHILKKEGIDMVLSGINSTSNASIEAIESSGTVSAVKSGAIAGIKGIAVSLASELGVNKNTYKNSKDQMVKMLREIRKNGFPTNVDILNVNIPGDVSKKTKWRICDLENTHFKNYVMEKKDPRGNVYYWLWGNEAKRFTKGTDCYELFKKHALTITPMEIGNISKDLKKDTAVALSQAIIA